MPLQSFHIPNLHKKKKKMHARFVRAARRLSSSSREPALQGRSERERRRGSHGLCLSEKRSRGVLQVFLADDKLSRGLCYQPACATPQRRYKSPNEGRAIKKPPRPRCSLRRDIWDTLELYKAYQCSYVYTSVDYDGKTMNKESTEAKAAIFFQMKP